MLWLLFVILATTAWAAYDLLSKVINKEINYFFALLIIGLFQIILAVPFVIYYSYNGGLNYTFKGELISAVMGILLGLGAIFFFYNFKYGGSASIAIPVYGIGTLIIGAIGGILFFKEVIDIKVIIGFIFGIVSIVLLTTSNA